MRTLSYAVSASFTRRYLSELAPLSNAAGSLIGASVVLLPLAFMQWPQQPPDLAAWSSTLMLGVLSTGLAYVLFFRLIDRIGSTRAITVTFLIPVFGMLWGALFLGESTTLNMVAGTVVILLGTALTTGLLDPARGFKRTAAEGPVRRTAR